MCDPGEPLAFTHRCVAMGTPRAPCLPLGTTVLCGLTQWFSPPEFGKEQVAYLLLTKDPTTFMLAFSPKDEQNMGLSFYSRHPSNFFYLAQDPFPCGRAPSSPTLPGFPARTPACSPNVPSLPPAADKPQATQEQMREFHETIMCMGMQKSEIVYTDEKQVKAGRTGPSPPSG